MKYHTQITFRRDKDCVEKAVLPTVIFVNSNHPTFGELRTPGFCIGLGWWDWSVKFFVILKNKYNG